MLPVMTSTAAHTQHTTADREAATETAAALEKRGRRWLLWSFIFCPCHLPLTMAVLATVLGGSAFGAFVSRNALGVGLLVGAIYLVGVAIGFRHIRAANAGRDCSTGSCEL